MATARAAASSERVDGQEVFFDWQFSRSDFAERE